MQGKKVFVTGATGFIGAALCERLLSEGATVRGLARNPDKGRALAALGVEVIEGDITDQARMTEAVAGADVVMHLAAHTGPGSEETYRRANVEATRSLAQVSAALWVNRFVYASSMVVLGIIGDGVADETKPLDEYNDRYGDSKIGAERALREVEQDAALEIVIARPGMVYGPGSPNWSVRMVRLARSGLALLIGEGQAIAYPIYLDDLLDGLLLCATQPDAAAEAFNFVGDPTTWAAFWGGFQSMLDRPRRMWHVPRWMATLGATLLDPVIRRRNLHYAVDMVGGRGIISNGKAIDVLGWWPKTSLEEGMLQTEAWLREAGHL